MSAIRRMNELFRTLSPRVQMLVIGALVLFARDPRLFFAPRFWAEEGTVFFAFAKTHGALETLSLVKFGYFNLTNNVAALLASFVPLVVAPFVTMAISTLVFLLGIFVIASTDESALSEQNKWTIFLLFVFIMPSNEVWLNTINLQSYYCAILFVIGVLPVPSRIYQRTLFQSWLVLAALSGPNSVLAAPAFAVKAWQEKSRSRAMQAMLLFVCGGIHALMFVRSFLAGVPEVSDRLDIHSSLVCFFPLFLMKSISLPLLGHRVTDGLGTVISQSLQNNVSWFMLVVLGLVALGILFTVFRKLPGNLRLFAPLFFCTQFVAVAALARGSKFAYLNSFGGGRYFYSVNFVFFTIVYLASLTASTWQRRCLQGAVVLALFWGISGYWRFMPGGPSWREEVRHFEIDPGHQLQIWPEGWKIDLASQSGALP